MARGTLPFDCCSRDSTAFAVFAGIPNFGAMKTRNAEAIDETEVCECGHRASQHDAGEGSCKAAGCECEAMEPMLLGSDEGDEDADEPLAL